LLAGDREPVKCPAMRPQRDIGVPEFTVFQVLRTIIPAGLLTQTPEPDASSVFV
jgi:hypothetical protein